MSISFGDITILRFFRLSNVYLLVKIQNYATKLTYLHKTMTWMTFCHFILIFLVFIVGPSPDLLNLAGTIEHYPWPFRRR